jgi:transposase
MRKPRAKKAIYRILIVLAVADDFSFDAIANILRIFAETVRLRVNNFIMKGLEGLSVKKQTGRPPKLTKSQKKQLSQAIIDGPEKAGHPGACWRSPMIQDLIYKRFGVFYSVNYISQFLKNMGFSYQKAKFISDHLDEKARREWLEHTWPEIRKPAYEKDSLVLFGDEASFPQWGSLSYTWALRGKQPTVKTSGIRKSYKVLGLIDYFTGEFFCRGHEARLNSETYQVFLQRVSEPRGEVRPKILKFSIFPLELKTP